jgi:molecular chaperone DnaK
VREAADLRNEVDSLCYATERTITEAGEAVTSANKQRAEEIMAQMREKAHEEVPDEVAIKSLMNDLRGVVVLIQQEQAQAQAASGATTNGDNASGDSGTTDGDTSNTEADSATGEPVA